jgi:transposase
MLMRHKKSVQAPNSKPTSSQLETLDVVHPNAAGVDIGSREIWISLPPDREGETVRCFGTFTPDLGRLVHWLLENQVDTVAMESTGVYWIPLFELLEAHHIQASLVNDRDDNVDDKTLIMVLIRSKCCQVRSGWK